MCEVGQKSDNSDKRGVYNLFVEKNKITRFYIGPECGLH